MRVIQLGWARISLPLNPGYARMLRRNHVTWFPPDAFAHSGYGEDRDHAVQMHVL
jgi:hypothetical protein